MNRVIGLFVYVMIHRSLHVVCQRRGHMDPLNHFKREQLPHLLGPTCIGKMRDGEESLDTLWRVCEESLGDSGMLPRMDENVVTLLDSKTAPLLYGVLLPEYAFADIRLLPSSGGLVFLSIPEAHAIHPLRDAQGEVCDEVHFPKSMSNEYIEPLKKGFSLLKTQKV